MLSNIETPDIRSVDHGRSGFGIDYFKAHVARTVCINFPNPLLSNLYMKTLDSSFSVCPKYERLWLESCIYDNCMFVL